MLQALSPNTLSLRERAQALFDHRRARQRSFGEHARVFQEAAWDILLELFICQEQGLYPPTTSVGYAANVPRTTALRALKKLESEGLVAGWTDPSDSRVRRVELTLKAIAMMESYLHEV